MPEPTSSLDRSATSDTSLNESSSSASNIFTLPFVNDNSDGWGPNNLPEKYKDLPYQKFSKSDKIGKIADFASVNHPDKKNYSRYQPQFSVGNVGQYSYFHDEDESQFTLVDQSKAIKTSYQKKLQKSIQNKNIRKQQQQYQQNKQPNMLNSKLNKQDRSKQIKKQKQFQNKNESRSGNFKAQIKQREPSVKVKEDWKVIEEIDFSRLAKLNLPLSEDPVDLKICGSLEYYDKNYDRINTKSAFSASELKRTNRLYHKVTTTDDPVIRQLAKTEGNVFATDSIIATLMCCSRSVYPWDIVVSKVQNKIFLDKRDGSTFELLTVNETSTDPPQEDNEKHINSPNNLALEATYINHNLSQQVLLSKKERYTFPDPNPFVDGNDNQLVSVAYRYRKWDLGNDIKLIVRSEIDAITTGPNEEKLYLNIKALNEWDPKHTNMDWRMKLDSQPGAVLATEIKNNGCKLAKWTVCSMLAGSNQIKFGFVSRVNVRATDKHVILGMQQFKPHEFANQIALNIDNAWGIIRCIIDFLNKQKDGKYVIMKDPNKTIIRIYEVPDNSLSDEEQQDQDAEDEN